MPVAGDDHLCPVHLRERYEIVVVRILSRAWNRGRIFDPCRALGDERYERFGAAN